MKQKYKIDSSEIKRILEMHDKENPKKLIILEQNEKLRSDLQELLDNKCFWGEVTPMPYTGNFNFAIRFESKNTPGKYFYAFIDKSIYEYDDDTTKKNFRRVKASSGMDGDWECSKTHQEDLQAKLTDLKTREGWVAYDELEANGMSKQGADSGKYGELKIFDLGNGKKVKLYKAPGKEGITKTGYTDEQTKTIKRYQDKGYKLADDLTNDEKLSWTPQNIKIPGLPDNFVMYVDPEQIAKNTNIEMEFKTASESQDIELKPCKSSLEIYYKAFKSNKKFPQSQIRAMREKVQNCVDQHDPNWGGLRPGYFRDMVSTMRGGKNGPSSYGDDSFWKLN